MSLTEGQQALIRRIVTMGGGTNVSLPNGPGKALPRYVVQAAGGSQRTLGLSKVTDARPEISVRVEVAAWPDGQYATQSDTLVAALVARFAVADQFDGVTIEDAPNVRPPMPVSDGVYCVPVIIRGRCFF
ncbi:hypothetical protein JF540_22965 [Salipiger thiooxidans]|uniref:hypothetical protein n=1 Tax=Salipiger thiooxidans TaxID=282683 RepID=UPI001A8D7C3A|nr:hypothetical protein [Salipiger thiooxidans]MBN8189551.1 hypothetical protein [Salipiger thiooxidans]